MPKEKPDISPLTDEEWRELWVTRWRGFEPKKDDE